MSCGLFCYVGKNKISPERAKKVMSYLEVLKETEDDSPLGGHGAGYIVLSDALVAFHKKVGLYSNKSPVDLLFEDEDLGSELNFFIGHVRRASDKFSDPDLLDELHAQPFMHSGIRYKVYCAHNGFLKNYEEMAKKFQIGEYFTDSDVLTQVFLKVLEDNGDLSKSCEKLFTLIDGNNTAIFLVDDSENFWLVVLHTGRTRGLVILENTEGEILISSRKSALEAHFSDLINKGGFFETLHVGPKEQNYFINWWRVESQIPFTLSEY